MKLCGSWLVWLALAAAASSAAAQAPVLSTLEAPYPALQSRVTMAGSTYGAGAVAYGPVGTPLVLSGSGLGNNGAVQFVSYKNGVVDPNTAPVLAVVTLWSPNQIIFKTPSNAVSGLVEVVVGGKVSNGLPFIVTPGAYGASCPSAPPANQLQITTDSLQNATVNQSYSVQLAATGGSSPYTWSVVSGSLPSGLSLSSSGLLAGTPSSPSGQTTFTVQAIDTGTPQQHDEATLTLQVEGASSAGLYSFSIQAAGGGAEGYDAVGNVTGYTDSVNGSWSFSYDSLNRLATATGSQPGNPYPDACWQYDNYGNRLWQTTSATAYTPSQNGGPNPCPAGSGPSSWAQYNTTNTNRIDASALSFSYDAAGNVKSDGINSYLYDGEGRICAVQKSVSGLVTNTQYLYDAEGHRVAKGSISSFNCDTTANGFTATAVYVLGPDGEQMTEMAANNSGVWQWAHTNVFAPGLSATYDADLTGQSEGAMYFHLSDWLGTRRQQTDYVGNPVLNFTGLPYGDGLATFPVSNTNVSDATEHHFTGKERDTESGNDYFGARYFASAMGRWMSPDRINVTEERMMNPSSTLNKYAYGANNPLKYTDPDGQDITIYYEAGIPYPGHTMLLAYNQQTGDSAVRSFGPDHAQANTLETAVGIPVPSTDKFGFENIKSADDLRRNFTSITIQTTPEEAQQVIDAIRAHPDGDYTTYWNNCTTTCSKLLRSIGKTASHAVTPLAFFNELYGEKTGLGTGRSPRNFLNGHDYGSPRQGYDSFNMFFLLMNAPPSTVTTWQGRGVVDPCTVNPKPPAGCS